MRPVTRRNIFLGLVVICLIVAVIVFLGNRHSSDRELEGKDMGDVRGPSMSLVTIGGDIRGPISPGVMVPLKLSLDNPNDFAVSLEKITVTVIDVDAPRADTTYPCAVDDFTVRQFSGPGSLTLDGGIVEDLNEMGVPRVHWPAVGMRNRPANQDGCKEATVTLSYEATGGSRQSSDPTLPGTGVPLSEGAVLGLLILGGILLTAGWFVVAAARRRTGSRQ